jgi:membrane protease YdiL (CAAX protease family)
MEHAAGHLQPAPGEPPAPPTERGARLPLCRWRPWTAPVALVAGLVLAALGGLVIDIPAAAFGAHITSSHTPAGLVIGDTFVQDLAFVGAAVLCAQFGGRAARAWMFGLRPPLVGWRRAVGMIALLLLAFLVLSVAWSAAFHPKEEKLLEQLGSNEGAALLVLSAALTCVVAPFCEEFLFRGFIFVALRNWRGSLTAAAITGVLFGGVHVGSAPALDLVPLAALGFGLCLLYRQSGSLYPCMVAHSLNNCIAFASLEDWSFGDGLLLAVLALAGIGVMVRSLKLAGVIAPQAPAVGGGP